MMILGSVTQPFRFTGLQRAVFSLLDALAVAQKKVLVFGTSSGPDGRVSGVQQRGRRQRSYSYSRSSFITEITRTCPARPVEMSIPLIAAKSNMELRFIVGIVPSAIPFHLCVQQIEMLKKPFRNPKWRAN